MFKWLEEMLKSFFQTVGELTAFALGLIDDSVYVVKLLNKVLLRIHEFFTWLPSSVVSLIVIMIAVVVIYKILGREG